MYGNNFYKEKQERQFYLFGKMFFRLRIGQDRASKGGFYRQA